MAGIRISVHVSGKDLKDVNFQSIIARKQRNTTAPELIKLFSGTVDGWENKPNFGYKQIINSSRVGVTVGPQGSFGGSNRAYNIYNLVSRGSPAHPIPKQPFKRKWLHFRTGYVSSTRPGDLISNRKSYSGSWVMARQVNHLGFEAREFDKHIAEEYNPKFVSDMQEAINEAVK